MQMFVYVEGFVFHICAGILSMTPWDRRSCSQWKKGCIHVTASCKVEAPFPGSYIFVVHQLDSALEIVWIRFLCSKQMARPSQIQLPCTPDVSRVCHTCYAHELRVYSVSFI